MKYPLASNTWDEREIAALNSVMASGRYTMGLRVQEFETKFAAKMGVKHAVMVNSGSSANLLMIASLVLNPDCDLSPGDEVIVPAVSWSTTYFPLTQYGLKIVFVDIERATLNIDPIKLEAAITPRTKAIMAVNLLGNSCHYSTILDVANRHGLILIEDNCESLGGNYGNRPLGTIGKMGTFSFFFSHHMQTMEGGMIVTDDDNLVQYLKSLRAHGWTRDLPDNNLFHPKSGDSFHDSFTFVLPGYCVRPLEMSGAVGSVQLAKLDDMISVRRTNAELFTSFDDDRFEFQTEVGDSAWFGFSIVLTNSLKGRRADFLSLLTSSGVEVRPIVAGNFTRNPVIKHMPHEIRGSLESADYIHENGLFIGNDSRDLSAEIQYVHSLMKDFK